MGTRSVNLMGKNTVLRCTVLKRLVSVPNQAEISSQMARKLKTLNGNTLVGKDFALTLSGLVGFMGNGDLWGLIFTHKSEWGFMGIYNILRLWGFMGIYNIVGLSINPNKSGEGFMGEN